MLLHASPKLPAHTVAAHVGIDDEQFQLAHGGFVGAPFAFQIALFDDMFIYRGKVTA